MEKRIFYFVIAFIMSLGFTAAQAQNMGMMDKKSYVGVSAIISGEFEDDVEYNSGWFLNYGYQFTDMFAGEIAYGKLADAKGYGVEAELDLIEVSVLARMPGRTASPFIRLGYSDIDLSGSEVIETTNEAGEVVLVRDTYGGSESDFLIGVGVDFNIGESAAIRLEYNQADYDGAEFERIQLGTIIRF
ncbi:MAG: outer membrane beta-barrel protein [Parvibaculales bacterium]